MLPILLIPLTILAFAAMVLFFACPIANEEEGLAVDENGHLFHYTKITMP